MGERTQRFRRREVSIRSMVLKSMLALCVKWCESAERNLIRRKIEACKGGVAGRALLSLLRESYE